MDRARIVKVLTACCLAFLFILFITARSDVSRFSTLTNCTGCHDGTTNPSGGATFGNVPSTFTAGQAYNLALTLTGGTVYGFQVAAVYSDGTKAGTLSSSTANTTVTSSGLLVNTRPLTSGTIAVQWTAPSQSQGPVTFRTNSLSANDNGSTSGDNMFSSSVTVSPAAAPPPNQPPQISSPGNQTSAAGAAVSLQVQASDPDGGSLSYSATGLPPGLSINSTTGRIGGTIATSASGSYNAQVTVSDGTASASASFTWTVTAAAPPPNQPPQISSPGNQTSAAGATVSLQIQASDPDGGSLSYSATGLPPGLSINATTGRITGTVSSSASGTYNTQVTVSDGTASASVSFTWTVTATPSSNQPPQVTSPGNQTSAAGSSVSLQIQASDPESGSLSYSATGLPPGLSINATTGRISGTVSSSASGTYNTQVTVSDGALTASASFTWTVAGTSSENHPPQVTSPGNQTSTAGASVSLQIQASDQDGDPLSYSATGLPTGLSINSTTGAISGTVSLLDPGVYTVTVSVSDGTGTSSATFSWTVSAGAFSEALYFSQFGNGTSPRWITGTDGVKLFSQITLVNLSSKEQVQAIVDIRDDDGNLLPVGLNGEPTGGSKHVVIPAAGSVFLKTDGTGDLRTGSVSVRSDGELSGAIVVGSELGRIAYADNRAVGAFLAPANQDGLGTGASAEIVRIGVSIMNLEDEETTVHLQLLDAEGRLQATGQVTLPPHGHLARFIDELTWSGVPNCNGTLRGAVAGTGRVAVAVVGVAPTGFWSLPVIRQD